MGGKSLVDVADIVMGQSPKGDSYNEMGNGIPLLNGPTEFGAQHPTPKTWTTQPTKLCRAGDILFCVRGSTTGRMNWADREYCLGRGVAAFRSRTASRDDTRFLYYSIIYDLPKLLGLSAGSVFPNLSKSDFETFKIHWPSFQERKAIAKILGMLDDQIELNQCMNQTLEDIARATFKSWFSDFDPVYAKAERRLVNLPADIAAFFPDSFDDSPLGKIPRGWKATLLPEIIDVNPPRSLRKGETAPYLDMANMPTRGHRAIDWIKRPFGSGTKFINGDTLLARITPCLENGKTAFVDFLAEEQVGWGSTEYIILHPKPPLPAEYGYYLARSDELRNHTIQNMTGTSGRQRAPASCFDKYMLVVPPENLANYFGELVRSIMNKIRSNDEQSSTLVMLRDTLLPRLMSGEVHMPFK